MSSAMTVSRRPRSFHSSSKDAEAPRAGFGGFLASCALVAAPPRQDRQNTTANSSHFFILFSLENTRPNLLCKTNEQVENFAWNSRKDHGAWWRHHTIGAGGPRKPPGRVKRTGRRGCTNSRCLLITECGSLRFPKGPPS